MSVDSRNKRNYIRRKKYLNESVEQIKSTLDFIAFARNEKVSEEQVRKLALLHAESIEAACWSPHTRLSSDNYQTLMSTKTRELCRVILKKALPNFDLQQLQKMLVNASSNAKVSNTNSSNSDSSASNNSSSHNSTHQISIPNSVSDNFSSDIINMQPHSSLPSPNHLAKEQERSRKTLALISNNENTHPPRSITPQPLPVPFLPSSAPTLHLEFEIPPDPISFSEISIDETGVSNLDNDDILSFDSSRPHYDISDIF